MPKKSECGIGTGESYLQRVPLKISYHCFFKYVYIFVRSLNYSCTCICFSIETSLDQVKSLVLYCWNLPEVQMMKTERKFTIPNDLYSEHGENLWLKSSYSRKNNIWMSDVLRCVQRPHVLTNQGSWNNSVNYRGDF